MIYFIYGKTKECKSDRFCISWLYSNFEKFWNDILLCKKVENNGCNRKFVKEFDIEVLKIKKQLYDFLESLNDIKNIFKGQVPQKNLFCNYVNNIFDIYHLIHDEDGKHKLNKYTNELKLFEEKFQGNNMLSELKKECNNLDLSKKLYIEKINVEPLSEDADKNFRPLTVNISEYTEKAPTFMVHKKKISEITYLHLFFKLIWEHIIVLQ